MLDMKDLVVVETDKEINMKVSTTCVLKGEIWNIEVMYQDIYEIIADEAILPPCVYFERKSLNKDYSKDYFVGDFDSMEDAVEFGNKVIKGILEDGKDFEDFEELRDDDYNCLPYC